METRYTKEQIEEARKQAEANIELEETKLEQIKENAKILRKEKNEYRKR